ncbi:helix-turn-helix domain-containing protein [Alkalimonas delamerensis]|uniref:Helix-turn-helix domain-containing protein n=1 Tax=Alkalimonas delamerensis TaxID=265981 RepID=A0ABT9GL65_9GAMM|nr:helix-turn-helix domain-containing protein [Alkalimonas delamerensis]MDP4527708.1 helix-turn-helix domain-containing protein [Alkalimonas delamerensis]
MAQTPVSTINEPLQLARELLEHTGRNLFLTGKAGTGKTSFLRELKQHSPKRMVVTAPTGVAAVNAGGVTLHSFFQLPFGPWLPGSSLVQPQRFSQEKINLLRSLNLLVIDEISMVRADTLDAVDAVLRRYRRNNQPFGGVQLLMIGDLHQLAPVVKAQDWELLKSSYDNGYFFSSKALQQTPWLTIELQRVYRQSDPRFIELLNKVRDNQLDEATLALLNSRYQPDFQPASGEDYITLTTHNHSADAINEQQLARLPGPGLEFTAVIEGDYPSQNYPVAETLLLKVGAQVMFMRNDNAEQRYYNGKTGVITQLDKESVSVRCPGEAQDIQLSPVSWENIKYGLDKASGAIQEQVIGSFKQIPLRLAWAVTIHKSQGLTFERAIIDGEAAFSHGQIYVALSRCKRFDGLVLKTPLSARSVLTDQAVSQFSREQALPDQAQVQQAKIDYQQALLLDAFDFSQLGHQLRSLSTLLHQQQSLIRSSSADQLAAIRQRLDTEVLAVASSFERQLKSLFHPQQEPQQQAPLLERLNKAGDYFKDKLSALQAWLDAFAFDTDNQAIRKQLTKTIEQLRQQLAIKQAALHCMQQGFTSSHYLDAVARAQIDTSNQNAAKKAVAKIELDDLQHPELFEALKRWRADKASSEQVAHFRVLHQQVLLHIANALPGNKPALLALPKVGPATVEKYGDALLQLVADYCQQQDLQPNLATANPTKATARSNKVDSRLESFTLFKQGLSLEQIAERRGLVRGTIENHLAHYVAQGELELTELVSADKLAAVRQAAERLGADSLKVLKEELGEQYSYGEIKLALLA